MPAFASYVSFKVTRTTKILDLAHMKERSQNPTGQMEKNDALMNFVNRQAQEAILNPTLPDSYKDEVLQAAIETIHKVAESRAIYFAKHGEGRRKKLKSKAWRKENQKKHQK